MVGLRIVRAHGMADIIAVGVSPSQGAAYLGTQSPREIFVAPNTAMQLIDIDFGTAQPVDSFFIGASNARPDAIWYVQHIDGLGGDVITTLVSAYPMRLPGQIRERGHSFVQIDEPVTGRYFRFAVEQPATPFQIGLVRAGLALEWPYAYGSGRTPIDTSRITAHQDGGFGIDPGVVKTLFQWSFVDLDDATLDQLWAIAEERGESRTLIVVEGPDAIPKSTGVHYGLFKRFEAFNREDPAMTKWALALEEWR